MGEGDLYAVAAEGHKLWTLGIQDGIVIFEVRVITVVGRTVMDAHLVWLRARVRVVVHLMIIFNTASAVIDSWIIRLLVETPTSMMCLCLMWELSTHVRVSKAVGS
jgi:hypothetical protein